MKKYIVYKHTSKTTKKTYIGYTSKSLSERLHKHHVNALADIDTHFYRAIRKYGLEDFTSEILWKGDCHDQAKNNEIKYIEYFQSFINGYNQTKGGDGGWCVPEEKYEEWKENVKNPGEKNGRYCGFTDDEILECAFDFFLDKPFNLNKFIKYSSEEFGMPKHYNKWRFGGKKFIEAYSEKYNVPLENLKYTKSNAHKQKLSEVNKNRKWFSNDKLKISRQMFEHEITQDWFKGRKYGSKN
jgi:hypothetical protein